MKPAGELDNNNNNSSLKWLPFLQRALRKSGVQLTADTTVVFSNPPAIDHIIDLVERTEPRVLHNFIMSRLLVFLSPESNREMREAALQFYSQQGYIPEDYPRSVREINFSLKIKGKPGKVK